MLIQVFSTRTVAEVATALETAVAAHRFGVVGVHDLQATLAKKGVTLDHECRIFEVCQPQQAKRVLDADMRVSTALPCRISVYEEGGKTVLSTIKPSVMLEMFHAPALAAVAQEVEATLVAIMNDAARKPGS